MKVGLLLEGGAMRGMYTAGVIDVLLENNIKVDCIMGVSAGALFGINYKSRQNGRAYRFNMRYIKDKRYMSIYSLLTTGNIVNQEFCFYDIPETLDVFDYAAFKRTKGDFYAVVTNMKTGEAEYKKIEDCKKDIEWLRASGSMPFVSRPVNIDGNEYLDGGISDSIPIKKMMSMGMDKVIVVLTRPQYYRKRKTNMSMAKIVYRKYPKFINTMAKRYKEYNKSLDEVEFLRDEKEIFLIRPSQYIKMKHVEKNEKILNSMYQLGVNDCKNNIEKLKDYLKE